MNNAYNRCLFIRMACKLAPVYPQSGNDYLPGCRVQNASVHPAVGWTVGNLPGSSANYIYSPGIGKMTEVQLYMLTYQPGSRLMRAFSDA